MKLYGSLFKKHQKNVYLQAIQSFDSKDSGLLQLDEELTMYETIEYGTSGTKNEKLSDLYGRDGLTVVFDTERIREPRYSHTKDNILKQYGPFLDRCSY